MGEGEWVSGVRGGGVGGLGFAGGVGGLPLDWVSFLGCLK